MCKCFLKLPMNGTAPLFYSHSLNIGCCFLSLIFLWTCWYTKGYPSSLSFWNYVCLPLLSSLKKLCFFNANELIPKVLSIKSHFFFIKTVKVTIFICKCKSDWSNFFVCYCAWHFFHPRIILWWIDIIFQSTDLILS